MVARSYWRGHEIILITEDVWVYADTKQEVSANPYRACGKCGESKTSSHHDACIANLPGVDNACCGHGDRNDSYIQFDNGVTVRGFIVEKEGDGS